MIHSLSGGVIDCGEIYSFAKVKTNDRTGWFLIPAFTEIEIGDRVVVPFGYTTEEGIVIDKEDASRQTAPVPLNRVKEIIKKAK